MKDVISVDELWIQIYFKENSIPSIHAGQMTEESKQQLHSLLISKLPEKKPTNSAFEERRLSTPESVQNSAYNSAIDDMRKSIDEMFEVQK